MLTISLSLPPSPSLPPSLVHAACSDEVAVSLQWSEQAEVLGAVQQRCALADMKLSG